MPGGPSHRHASGGPSLVPDHVREFLDYLIEKAVEACISETT